MWHKHQSHCWVCPSATALCWIPTLYDGLFYLLSGRKDKALWAFCQKASKAILSQQDCFSHYLLHFTPALSPLGIWSFSVCCFKVPQPSMSGTFYISVQLWRKAEVAVEFSFLKAPVSQSYDLSEGCTTSNRGGASLQRHADCELQDLVKLTGAYFSRILYCCVKTASRQTWYLHRKRFWSSRKETRSGGAHRSKHF